MEENQEKLCVRRHSKKELGVFKFSEIPKNDKDGMPYTDHSWNRKVKHKVLK